MDESFIKVRRILEDAWPALSEIRWPAYGDKIIMYKERIPKYTGMVFHYHSLYDQRGAYTVHHGLLLDPPTTLNVITTKVDLLLEGAHSQMASMSFRNPDKGHWGGAVRSHMNPNQIYAISGLPEIGDHLVLVFALHKAGVISTQEIRDLSKSTSRCKMAEAREFVGMSEEQFLALKHHIEKVV